MGATDRAWARKAGEEPRICSPAIFNTAPTRQHAHTHAHAHSRSLTRSHARHDKAGLGLSLAAAAATVALRVRLHRARRGAVASLGALRHPLARALDRRLENAAGQRVPGFGRYCVRACMRACVRVRASVCFGWVTCGSFVAVGIVLGGAQSNNKPPSTPTHPTSPTRRQYKASCRDGDRYDKRRQRAHPAKSSRPRPRTHAATATSHTHAPSGYSSRRGNGGSK